MNVTQAQIRKLSKPDKKRMERFVRKLLERIYDELNSKTRSINNAS